MLGTGHLLCAVGQQSMVANLMPPGRFDSAFGYYTFAGTVGQAAGPGLLAFFGSTGALPRTDDAFLASAGVALVLVAGDRLHPSYAETGAHRRAGGAQGREPAPHAGSAGGRWW